MLVTMRCMCVCYDNGHHKSSESLIFSKCEKSLELGVNYAADEKTWMNNTMFLDWRKYLNSDKLKIGRNILIMFHPMENMTIKVYQMLKLKLACQ